MIATAIANYLSEVARPLGNRMDSEVATKSKGFSRRRGGGRGALRMR